MKSVEQLIADWQAGAISPEDLAQLKEALRKPAARSELVDEWLLDQALHDSLRARPEESPATAGVAKPPARSAQNRPVSRPRRLFPRWLVWREKEIPLTWPLGATVVACLVVMGLGIHFQRAAVGKLTAAPPQLVLERDGQTVKAAAGHLLYPKDTLRVPPEATGPATLQLGAESTWLELAPGAELRVMTPFRGKRLYLATGTLEAQVAPQPRWRPMTIFTPQASATVVGTRLSVSVTGAVTRVSVVEGAVRVRKTLVRAIDTLAELTIRAGEVATVSPDANLALAPLTGMLSSERWLVPSGTPLQQAAAKGSVLAAAGSASLPAGSVVVERLFGYLVAPASGDYTFYIAAMAPGTPGELWLSTDEQPSRKRQIASTGRPGTPNPAGPSQPQTARSPGFRAAMAADWQRSPSQKSPVQRLVEGRRYYVEIWHEGYGLESLALGWIVPGQPAGASPAPINVDSLSPYPVERAQDRSSR